MNLFYPPFTAPTCFSNSLKMLGFCVFLLIECFVNCNRDSDRCADHGVIAHAEEAHHFHGHSTNRWSVETLAGTSGRGTLISCILENTSVAKRALCFDYNGIISHDLFTKQWGSELKYTLERLFYIFEHL